MAKTVRMTVAQAIVKFLDNQYVSMDGEETKFVEGFFTIFGHGIAVGLGEALDTNPGNLRVLQGRNEQGMCHVATAYAKQNGRKKIIPCASSVGPGAANMVTACATATVNNIPLLVFPADTFASRQPDPVLQQLEQSNSLSTTTNDAFKPVCKYWDRVTRPEHIMTALINAMRVLTDPAETGACCIGLCQDVEGESFDFPEYFFEKRVHRITRPVAVEEEIEDIANVIANAKKPLVIVGGGVRYSVKNSRFHLVRHREEKVHVDQAIHTAWEESVLQVLMHPMFLQKMRMWSLQSEAECQISRQDPRDSLQILM